MEMLTYSGLRAGVTPLDGFDLKKHFPGLLREESEVRIRRVL